MGLTTGGHIRIRQVGNSDWCDGTVWLLSENGRAALVALDDALRVNGGLMLYVCPVSIDTETETVTGLMGEEYEIEERGE